MKLHKYSSDQIKPDYSLPRLYISTASAIVSPKGQPWLILIGDSIKHSKPVIPGGKIESCDGVPGVEFLKAARSCIVREVSEETGLASTNPRFLFQRNDSQADIRVVDFNRLRDCIGISPDAFPVTQMIRAHYGAPDVIFYIETTRKVFKDTEELKNLRYIDVRTSAIDSLGGGLSSVAQRYREILQRAQRIKKQTLPLDLGKLQGVSLQA